MINDRQPQSEPKNGEKKGEPFESHASEQRGDPANTATGAFAEQAARSLEQAQQLIRQRAEALRQRLAPVEKWVSSNTREHPYEAIAAAGGAALVAGVLLRRAVSFGLGVTFVLLTAYSLFRKPGSAKQTDFSTH